VASFLTLGHLLHGPDHEVVGIARLDLVAQTEGRRDASATRVVSPADAAETVTCWMFVIPRSFFSTVGVGDEDHIVLILTHARTGPCSPSRPRP
jgi:hypothetical protein